MRTPNPIRPLKKFSQNFLRSPEICGKIVESMSVQPDDVIVEIGPGEGALTEWLVQSPAREIIAIELDERCVAHLQYQFNLKEKLKIIRADILDVDFGDWCPDDQKIRIVGNLPYAISSPILFKLLGSVSSVQDATLMLQKEVAERIAASPGSKAYGIPSVFTQLQADVDILFPVLRDHFHPRPNVDSAVIRLRFLPAPRYPITDDAFFNQVVRSVFGQRRKMLRRTLRGFIKNTERLSNSPIDPSRRPEDLSVQEFAELCNFLFENRS